MSLMNHTDSLLSVAWSPDGRLIATTSDEADTSVRLWDASTGAELHKLSGHPVRVWGLAFSPDSRMLVTGGARGVIKAWDTTNGDLLYTVNDVADHIGNRHVHAGWSVFPDHRRDALARAAVSDRARGIDTQQPAHLVGRY
jgi:WD40 repeat protein